MSGNPRPGTGRGIPDAAPAHFRRIEAETYTKQYLLPFEPLQTRLEQYRAQDLAVSDGGRWRLTPRGFLVSNAILAELLEAQERSAPPAKKR